MEIFTWLQTHWSEIVFALTSIVTGVSIIVRLTPTLKDDNIWLPIVKFLSKYIALNRTTDDNAIRNQQE
ncbi:MAG: hypothetical protein COY66_05070 [Candidatus Kerfeldbacteria bacterium CG_4_10_14_0_8_um_filter_42_10]|uniref:Uncharacterized protein n=1 Tax=Candidatus Kerfeldbacteria bacterium CG_4_10_14_0_8_um_filter_42_10 TaxID=2014248 RepID=A0A2M7RHQ9_9BACT|nr:MAG: hypothetical protein COY66_05070 [Candidatus Kerfeldbacteria bacterium CG_4_10_14_0_8_um_filter_42_10]